MKSYQKIIDTFFAGIGIKNIELQEIQEQGKTTININIILEHHAAFIFKQLPDIQNILYQILEKEKGEKVYIRLDVNHWKKEKERLFLEKILSDSQKLQGGQSLFIHDISAYHRRLLHQIFQDNQEFQTKSFGEKTKRVLEITKFPQKRFLNTKNTNPNETQT